MKRDKELDYLVWMHLLAFRCKFLATPDGRTPLTKKGWGWIKSGRFWRVYNLVMCAISKKHKTTMLQLLDYYIDQETKNN